MSRELTLQAEIRCRQLFSWNSLEFAGFPQNVFIAESTRLCTVAAPHLGC
jgi:hypothetical protein